MILKYFKKFITFNSIAQNEIHCWNTICMLFFNGLILHYHKISTAAGRTMSSISLSRICSRAYALWCCLQQVSVFTLYFQSAFLCL